MAYLIRSKDGRIRICTYSATAAAEHVMRLRQQGHAVAIKDINGKRLSLNRLRQEAEAA